MADSRKNAYATKQSTTTRNPHEARAPPNLKQLAKLSFEERIFEQWNAAFGQPVSDQAKAQFRIQCCGHTFELADVRLWMEHHMTKQSVKDDPKFYLEFFFDGMESEIAGQRDLFIRSFEELIQTQLQERRIAEFREKLAATRRRPRRGIEDAEGGDDEGEAIGNDEWKSFLKQSAPATELAVRSVREAGCMLRFLVCQTSISASAAETLGQIAFLDHFPVDGVYRTDTSEKPMPRWVYGMLVFLVFLCFIVMLMGWSALKPLMGGRP